MELLTGKIKDLYFRYFTAVFAGACIPCVYALVDMAVIGKYHGPIGVAAMSVVIPIFNIIYSLGFLVGIGGSVLFSTQRGMGHSLNEQNQYFTSAAIGAVILSLAVLCLCWGFEEELLVYFGADETLLPLSKAYLLPIKTAAPVFLFVQLISSFLRNDNAPALATKAVTISGIFNVFGDFFFVFGLDLGIFGAGLATGLGALICLLVMLVHFASKDNTLALVRVTHFFRRLFAIVMTGFSTFFIDFAVGIVIVLFNRQIMEYLGTDALAVFGILIQINIFVQCCGYSVGQAAQPILSVNFGAGRADRIKETMHYASLTAAALGVTWVILTLAFPNAFVHLFMKPTQSVLAIAPSIIRTYGFAFLLIPFNVFSTYYFQALMAEKAAFAVSMCRGLVICSILILTLPVVFGADTIWLSMPITELLTAFFAVTLMKRHHA